MKRAVVIVNPAASRTRPAALEAVLATLRGRGWEATSVATEDAGHAVELAAAAAGSGADVVAVYGGDGTVMQAVEGIRRVRGKQAADDSPDAAPVLGIIPGGTGNLLAGNLRIPRNPRRAAGVIAAGVARTIDLGHLETAEQRRFFAVGCGTGYDADMMVETTPEMKRRWGVAAYIGFVVGNAARLRPWPVRITIDGETTEREAISVVVANCRDLLPRLLKLRPEVRLDDGALDIVVFDVRGYLDVARATADLVTMREGRRVLRFPAREVIIEPLEPRPAQADGDLCGTTPLRVRVVPAALKVMIRHSG